MTNEIKEILEDYKKLAGEITLKLDNTAEYESWLIIQDYFDYLLDYITNLQEENERLREVVENLTTMTVCGDRKQIKNTAQFKLEQCQSIIDKANRILQEILVVSDWEHEGRYRPVKNTTAQDVYKTIIKLNELLETPSRQNYGLLQGEDKE